MNFCGDFIGFLILGICIPEPQFILLQRAICWKVCHLPSFLFRNTNLVNEDLPTNQPKKQKNKKAKKQKSNQITNGIMYWKPKNKQTFFS